MVRIATVTLLLASLLGSPGAEEIADQFELSFLEGSWVGKSADGRFEEHTAYAWSDDGSFLDISMNFFVEGEKTGEATGYMLTDDATGGLLFSILTSHGVVITQTELTGDRENVEMAASSINGARAGMPPEFRTRIHRYDENHYRTEMLILDGETWRTVMQNEFERVRRDR